MPSVLAIVSKAVFDKDAKIGGRAAGAGDVVPFDRYVSTNKGLTPLGEGGALFLVTVRPPDEKLWLVAVLEAPSFDGEIWTAGASTTPITDIGAIKSQLRFATGAGISAKPGALGMSLQTPRVLTEADVALLRGASGGAMGAVAVVVVAKPLVRLNAHEPSDKAPCLCKACFDRAPETVTIGALSLVRERAEARGRELWYWMPAALSADKEPIRRAVESRLHGHARTAAKGHPSFSVLLGRGKSGRTGGAEDGDG